MRLESVGRRGEPGEASDRFAIAPGPGGGADRTALRAGRWAEQTCNAAAEGREAAPEVVPSGGHEG